MTARKSRGQSLVESIRAEMAELGVKPTSTEEELLRSASSLADRLEKLEQIIERDGILITTRRGEPKTNPACVEARATTRSLNQTLGGIFLGESTTSPKKNPVKQRAARVRWDRERRMADRG